MANGRIKPTTDLIWRRGQKLRQVIDRVQPPDSLIMVSVRRQGSLLVSHGDTVLQPDDVLNVFVRWADEAQLRNCFAVIQAEKE